MTAFIALYRGINVGGKNPVKMDALRALHERLGHRSVKSYVQSGNIAFSAPGPAETITRQVAAAFAKAFGFAAGVLVIDADRLSAIVKGNPYKQNAAANPTTVHAGLCAGKANAERVQALLIKTGGNESFAIKAGVIYLHAPARFGRSKFAAGMERAAGVAMTVRNWRTIAALAEMARTEE